MTEHKVGYEFGGKKYEGMLVYDDSVKAKRPAIFMQPDGKGVCPDTIAQARAVAGKDYVVMMADMFGVGYGAKPKTQQDLMAAAGALRKDVPFIVAGGGKAFDTLSSEAEKLGLIDPSKRAAIGYCIGGGVAREEGRAGGRLRGGV